ncbi:hypothetical protein Hamer_G013411 [Homarus americanus]|uniref:Uncharacterized protein n=1 Tax=Homarus americanus TaxID=6706 RepID=A0A8J5KDR5_HOMAM|nr:hypothetical protein Hamer_G013411 [Homarus americanus]
MIGVMTMTTMMVAVSLKGVTSMKMGFFSKVYVAESISECHLGVVNVTTRLACANRCLQTQQCTLFCLKICEAVRMQPIDNKTQEWKGATVTKKIKNRTYEVETEEGKKYRRNRQCIRPTRVRRKEDINPAIVNKPQRSLEPEIQEELEGKPVESEYGSTPIAEHFKVEGKYRTRTGRDGCHLSNARVALHYTPQGTSTQCYSSWISNRDAASNASITSIGDYNAKLLETHATIGFYCYGERLCFSSIRTYRPWWAAKLGTRRRVTSVRIQIRRAAISYFEDVEIRVGDDENNINNNQLLGFYSGTASNGEVVTFTANPYVLGSIVYIQSLDNDYYMQLCDVQILYI